MIEPLTEDDFWDEFCVIDYITHSLSGFVCPRCGALVKDVPLHIEFHNG